MDSKIGLLLLSILAAVALSECDQHEEGHGRHHGRHHHRHNHTRREPSKLAQLKHRLFEGYDKTVNPDSQVVVTLMFTLMDLHICPHKEVLHLSGWLQMFWKDERLVWQDQDRLKRVALEDVFSTTYNADTLQVPSDDIWIPDILPFNLADGMKTTFLPWEGPRAVIKKDGTVIYIPPVSIKSYCKVNYENWPFGEQSCDLKIGSWTYAQGQIDINNDTLPCTGDCLDITHFQSSQVKIISTSVKKVNKKYDCCPDIYPRLEVNIKFQREAKFEKGKLLLKAGLDPNGDGVLD